ncbi:hypothetical protein [Paraglaciecola sp. L3A3]|uniref:hypothetical protein n=1 Tax=Paraglaciecola sp. L3A3 TaxID=2686358 RepID=UPI00131CB78D|nr:hypothetical protein [Paraglaciecola sp. L3A3]
MKNVILNKKLVRSVVLASSLLMSAFSAQSAVILSFSESDVNVDLNDSFSLSLYADTQVPVDGFLGFMMDAGFDSSVLSFDGFNLSSNFIAGAPTAPISAVYFDPMMMSPTIFGSDILLGTLEFTAIGSGSTTIETISESFQSILQFVVISTVGTSTNVTVNTPVVDVSTPATITIFGLALAMLVRRRV